MTVAIAIVVGAWVGMIISLIPGLSTAVALGVMVAMGLPETIGYVEAGCFVAAAAGTSIYTRNLTTIHAPFGVTIENLAIQDPAVRLVYGGYGTLSLRLMTYGTDLALIPAVIFGVGIAGALAFGINLARTLDTLIGGLGTGVILLWMFLVCSGSRRPFLTLLGLFMTGIYGWAILHSPMLSGSTHQMSILLAGLIGLPILWGASKETDFMPAVVREAELTEVNTFLGLLGAAMGCVTGFFAGLSSGSLVSMVQHLTESDEEYIVMASASNASNDVVALLLIISAGMGRSGEAIALGRILQNPQPTTIVLIVLAICYGIWLGRSKTTQWANRYKDVVRSIPYHGLILFVVLVTTTPIVLAGGWSIAGQGSVWGLALAGFLLTAWCKAYYLPNQVVFGSLTLPLLIQSLGLTETINGFLF